MRLSAVLAAALLAPPLFGQAPGDGSFDAAILKRHGLPERGPELLHFFHKRTLTAEQIAKFRAVFPKLGAASYPARLEATTALRAMGPVVRPLIVQAIEQPKLDSETRRRAQRCLDQHSEDEDALLAMATARQITRTPPRGAVGVLLAYLPYVANEAIRDEVQHALQASIAAEPDAAPLLHTALKDAHPEKRAAAAETLVRTGRTRRAEAVALLRDPSRQVRFQVARALVEMRDTAGLPVLIELLPDLPVEQAGAAEELLLRVAGDEAPDTCLSGRATAAAARDAWRAWHKKHAVGLDLAARLRRRELGVTVVAAASAGRGINGEITAYGPDGKQLWKFGGLRYPVDVQVLGKERVLLAEYYGRRVTERDAKGKVLWEKCVTMPICCQRLRNGQTFIATRQQLMIVDREGKEVFTAFLNAASILAARRLSDGQIVAVTAGGQCHVLDPLGREVRSFRVGQVYTLGGNIEALSGGRFLVPLYSENRVVEYDLSGQLHGQTHAPRPTSVTRLENGNLLITTLNAQRVVERSPEGKEVHSYPTGGRAWRARRR